MTSSHPSDRVQPVEPSRTADHVQEMLTRARSNFTYWRDVTAVNAAHDVLLANGIDNFHLAQDITEQVLAVADVALADPVDEPRTK